MPERSEKTESVRLFFALWPDDKARASLSQLAGALHQQCGGRRVPERNIHLTLLFIGEVAADLIAALARMADAVVAAPVALALDSVGYWRHNKLVWAGATYCPPSLVELAASLTRGARGLRLPTEARDYVPHITLLRRVARAPEQRDLSSIAWRATDFVLVQSATGQGAMNYRIIGRWPLAARE